jgi:hypothetical protein
MMGEINFHSASPFKSVHFAMLRKDNSLSKVSILGYLGHISFLTTFFRKVNICNIF